LDDDRVRRIERNVDRLFAVYEPYHASILLDEPASSAALLQRLADEAPDDEHLEALAISLVEAFLGVRGEDAYPLFEDSLRSSSNLRKAWSFAWSSVPDEWQNRFDALLQPGEAIGGTLTVEQGHEVARNELGGDGRYHTKLELQVVGQLPASKIDVVVFGSIFRVLLRPVGGGQAICAGGSGPESAGCTLQNPPQDGHVVVDIATEAPLTGPISLDARAW
jgi:hypothetical protein